MFLHNVVFEKTGYCVLVGNARDGNFIIFKPSAAIIMDLVVVIVESFIIQNTKRITGVEKVRQELHFVLKYK